MKNIHNKLIVVEGGDGAGKATQAKLLLEALEKLGVKTTYFDFPRYEDSFFGALTGRALKGDFGDFRHMSPYMSSLPYMLDRAMAKVALYDALRDGVVICNRYTSSNTAFQATKFRGAARKRFIEFLEHAEYDEIGLPRPELVVYLYVPPKYSKQLVKKKSSRGYLGKKNGARDQHERDQRFQIDVVKTYISLTKARRDWKRIDCCDKKGKLMCPEVIHSMVMELVHNSLA